MDFILSVLMPLDVAFKTLCLPGAFRKGLAEQRSPFRSNISAIDLYNQHISISATKSAEVRIGIDPPNFKLE